MSCRQERQLGAGAWNEVAREGWTGVKHPPGKQARWMGGGEREGKGQGQGEGTGVSGTFKGLGRGAGAQRLPR